MPLEPLRPGDPVRLGGYRLTARLGAGRTAVVLLGSPDSPALAAPTGAGGQVAVNLVHADVAALLDYRARFRREAAAARAVDAHCAAQVLAADPDAERPWLATEYVEGPDLAEAVALGGPLPEPTARALAVGLAEALVAIHAAGIVHRHLTPAHVLLTPGSPKVIGFGLARPASDGPSAADPARAGVVPGGPGCLAPEQAGGPGMVGPASDVWAWAVAVAFASTGRAPFGTGSAQSLLTRSLSIEPDLAGISGRLLVLLRSALRHDPAARPSAPWLLSQLLADAREPGAAAVLASSWRVPPMLSSLDTLAPSMPAGAVPAPSVPVPWPVPQTPPRPRRRWAAALAVAAAALVAAVAVGAGVAMRGSSPVASQVPAAQAGQGSVSDGAEAVGWWSGTFECGLGTMPVNLYVVADDNDPTVLHAVFAFTPAGGADGAGDQSSAPWALALTGSMIGRDSFVLTAQRWLAHSAGSPEMFALTGEVDGGRMSGDMSGGSCSTFSVTRLR